MSQRAYLIDASMVFFRYYFSMPDNWHSRSGQTTSTVYGFSHWLKRLLKDVQPQFVAACFDQSLGSCFRNQIYPDYKISRPLPDDNIRFQFNACQQVCELWGVPTYGSSLFEADDIIATLQQEYRKKGIPSTIISRDKDLGQLLGKDDFLWFYPDGEQLSAAHITDKFGVPPNLMADLQALCGDKIDDIPGVPGVGLKTAAKFINLFGQVENIFDPVKTPPLSKGEQRTRAKFIEHEQQIKMAKQLTVIRTDADLPEPLRLQKTKTNASELIHYGKELGFDLSKSVI